MRVSDEQWARELGGAEAGEIEPDVAVHAVQDAVPIDTRSVKIDTFFTVRLSSS